MSIAKVIFANSEQNADSFYLGKIFIPDPFLALEFKGKSFAFLSSLEYERAKKQSSFDNILSLEEWNKEAKERFSKVDPILGILKLFQKKYGVSKFAVSEIFPIGLGTKLKALGLSIEKNLFPERQTKTEEAFLEIRKSNKIAEKGFQKVLEILKKSKIKNNKLYFKGKILRSEFLRQEIEIIALRNNASAVHTIAASGKQSADPHCVGTGPVYANEFLIVDIFPRSTQSGYFGDMSRTFLRGRPSTEQEKMYEAVQKAQKLAIEKLKTGIAASSIHKTAEKLFWEKGFFTENNEGFIHSIGHGLGLEIHEEPRVSKTSKQKLRTGNVITIEPGLYYKELGGVRIEDVFAITKDGAKKLSHFPKTLVT